jgi:hypothetical protein
MSNLGYFYEMNGSITPLGYDKVRNTFTIPRGTYIPDWTGGIKEPNLRAEIVSTKRDAGKRLVCDVVLNAHTPAAVATFLYGKTASAVTLYEVDLSDYRIVRCLADSKKSKLAEAKNNKFANSVVYLNKSLIQYPFSMEYADVEYADVDYTDSSIHVLDKLSILGIDSRVTLNIGSSKTRYIITDVVTKLSFDLRSDVMEIKYTEDGKQELVLAYKDINEVLMTTNIGDMLVTLKR